MNGPISTFWRWLEEGEDGAAQMFVTELALARREDRADVVRKWEASYLLHTTPGACGPIESRGTEELARELEAMRPSS